MKNVFKTIAIRGGYGYGNFGDDALMAAVHGIATQLCPAREVGYLCQRASYLPALLPDAEILDLRTEDRLSARMLLFGGGTQFYSFPLTAGRNRGFARRAVGILKEPRLLPFKIARRIMRNHQKESPDQVDYVAALGVGLGPFAGLSSVQTQAKDMFAGMTYVSVRDVRSYEMCREWGVRNLHHHTDLCFWPGFQATCAPDAILAKDPSIRRVGIVVRDWPHDERGDSYHQSLLAVADRLSRTGKAVDFVLFAGRHDRGWLRRLEATGFHVALWNPEIDSIQGFTRGLASYDLFITARYHGAVFATLLGRPSICIEVEPKLSLFADVLGPAGRCWKYPFDRSECLRLVGDIEADYSRITAIVRGIRHQQSVLAARMVDEFLTFARNSMGIDSSTHRETTRRCEFSPSVRDSSITERSPRHRGARREGAWQ